MEAAGRQLGRLDLDRRREVKRVLLLAALLLPLAACGNPGFPNGDVAAQVAVPRPKPTPTPLPVPVPDPDPEEPPAGGPRPQGSAHINVTAYDYPGPQDPANGHTAPTCTADAVSADGGWTVQLVTPGCAPDEYAVFRVVTFLGTEEQLGGRQHVGPGAGQAIRMDYSTVGAEHVRLQDAGRVEAERSPGQWVVIWPQN